ncbi:outer membrane protein assembly factor BamA [Thermoflavifilum aggregans]|uniref:Outer membrane protein assembly factor BamA n=1 Tax=Thermoflavifilum aggregans TaxID=454188 RepID=A0A2M9CRM0_9BACT|nr:BamA/TamA family outer membrane protein [Thermoflavifilum aggregans]PJJ74537.1 outer membrane protein assembly factor BamA [Thermoflavifilum aggregans]
MQSKPSCIFHPLMGVWLCIWLLVPGFIRGQESRLVIYPVDSAAARWVRQAHIPVFADTNARRQYLAGWLSRLRDAGYWGASVDSLQQDSVTLFAWLYLGQAYRWGQIRQGNIPDFLWKQVRPPVHVHNAENDVEAARQAWLRYYENNGYPFATVAIDSLQLQDSLLTGIWHVEPGPLIIIDTLIQEGTARLSPSYLAYLLGIKPGEYYSQQKLQAIHARIAGVNFLQQTHPWFLEYRQQHAALHVTLDARKSNQIDGLLGYEPASAQDVSAPGQGANSRGRLVGQLTLHLVNSFHAGEVLDMHWEQLQYASPRLNLAAQLPTLWGTPYGLSGQFSLFRKDSSYLQLNSRLGLSYELIPGTGYRMYLQQSVTHLLSVDTETVKITHQLPAYVDQQETFLGFGWTGNHTDRSLNPRRGVSWEIDAEFGKRKIIPNEDILQLHDPADSSFSFASLYAALPSGSFIWKPYLRLVYYRPLGRYATLRSMWQGAGIWGTKMFLNELYQIGGAELLRGFDEQSIYASQYLVWSLEYRYLIGEEAYVFGFSDNAYVYQQYMSGSRQLHASDWPTGLGLGMAFPTRVGFFRFSWAIGRRKDSPFDIQRSRIHFSYANTF